MSFAKSGTGAYDFFLRGFYLQVKFFYFSLILVQSKLFHVIRGWPALIVVKVWGKINFFDFVTFFKSKKNFFTLFDNFLDQFDRRIS